MDSNRVNFKTEEELHEAVLLEKARGTPDLEMWGE